MKTEAALLKKWFNISEAAKYLSISQDTLRRWEKKGKLIPRRTMGKHRRYSLDQLQEIYSLPIHPKLAITNKVEQKESVISPKSPPAKGQPTHAYKISNLIHPSKKPYLEGKLVTVALIISTLLLLLASYYLLSLANPISPEPLSPLL